MVDLKRYSAEGVHEKVLACMKRFQGGIVLDAPSGQGALSEELEVAGFKVFQGDLARENIFYRNGRCTQLDLNGFLPFKEDSFDYVVCVEGVEHLENPHRLIEEFARLVKEDGYLIITTPNVMALKSRLRFLFYGYLDFFRYFGPLPMEERHRTREFDHQHINPVFYGEMKFILEKFGFCLEAIETNREVRKWKAIFPFLKKIVRAKTKKKFRDDPFVLSDTLLEGEILIFLAKRRAGMRT